MGYNYCTVSFLLGTLTEHSLQADQTGHKVVKVHVEVFLCIAQDYQLEQVVG